MNRSCRGIAAVVLAAGVGGLFACGGEESSKQCLAVQVYVPPTDKFPDLDPFKDCTSVEVCYTDPDTGKLEGCQNVLYGMAGSAAVESLPYGDAVSVVATCYLQQVDTQGATTVTAVSVGQTCPVKQDSECDTPANKYLYMGAINKFLPTVDPMAGAVTNPYESRWGATVTTLYDGKVLLAGGAGPEGKFDWADTTKLQNIKSSAEIYDPGNGTFTMVGTAPQQLMSEKRAFAAAVEVTSGQIAIFGGMKDSTQSTSSVDLYDPISMTFTAGPPMKDTRAYHTATALDYGEAGIYVLLVGGMGSGEGTWEVWDPLTGVVASGPLAEPRWNHTATLVSSAVDAAVSRDVVLIAGGEGKDGEGKDGVRDTVELFDLATQQMDLTIRKLCTNENPGTCIEGKPENPPGCTPPDPPAAKKTMHAAALVAKRHFVYIAGGFSDTGHQAPVADICVWKTTVETWQGQAGEFMLKKARGGLTATALPGNVVLFAGGLGKKSGLQTLEAVSTVEIVFEYVDPKTGQTVVDIGPVEYPISMLYPRWNHSAVVTCDGKVLMVGGLGGEGKNAEVVKGTELFNPQ